MADDDEVRAARQAVLAHIDACDSPGERHAYATAALAMEMQLCEDTLPATLTAHRRRQQDGDD
jgi:hypothetical protein